MGAVIAGIVEELTTILAPVVLGAGKLLFEGSTRSLDLRLARSRQSAFASFLTYEVLPS